MYNSHPAPSGLQVTMKKNSKFHIACAPWYISSGLINKIGLLLNTHSKLCQFEKPQPARHWYLLTHKQFMNTLYISRVSCQKGSTRHAYAWQIGPFLQDALDYTWIHFQKSICMNIHETTCNVKLYGHIITSQCSILFIQNTASHFHGTE